MMLYFGSSAWGLAMATSAWRELNKTTRSYLVILGLPKQDHAEMDGCYHLPFLKNEEVSCALQAAELLLLPYPDGVSERRTTFTSGLQHGCAIVTTTGESTGATLLSTDYCRIARADSMEAFVKEARLLVDNPKARNLMGRKAEMAYEKNYSWTRVIDQLQEKLERIAATGPITPR